MCAEVLRICIFAFLIFISEGIPQNYVESAAPGNGPPSSGLDYIPLSGTAPPVGDVGEYDDAGPDYSHAGEAADAPTDNAVDPNGPDYGPPGEDGDTPPDNANYPDDPDYSAADGPNGPDYDAGDVTGDGPPDTGANYDNAGHDYAADGYDGAEPGYKHRADYENAGAYSDVENRYEYQDYPTDYPDSGYEDNDDYGFGKYTPLQLKLPSSIEMLNPNKPEAGFDLTYNDIKKLKLWPDALIPYYIDVHSFNDKVMRDKIRSFLSSVNSRTALNFVELPSPPNNNIRWVFFINRRGLLGCADHSIRNFTNTGVQQVVLGYHCMSTEGELAEAVLSIAGVPAQHNSPDRDYYIKIHEENLLPDKKYLFEKRSDDEWLFHDMEYDFNSAGHFHSYKHSINGRATITPQEKLGDVTLGESKTLTASDILKLRMLYNYIVKKKLLQAPDCHKLFEPGNKFGQYKPNAFDLKPRLKPYRYTGESPDAPLEKDDDEVIEPHQDEDGNDGEFTVAVPDENINSGAVNGPDYNQIPDANEDYHTPNENINIPYIDDNEASDDYPAPVENENADYGDANTDPPQPDYDYNYDIPMEKPSQEDESDNYSPSDFHSKKMPTIVNIAKGSVNPGDGPNLNLAGLEPKVENPQLMLPLKSPQMKTTKKPPKNHDLLAELSDFQTDDEDDVWAKTGKGKLNKLSFQKNYPKIDLKFKTAG